MELEIVVSDDSPGDAIGTQVARANDPRVRYVKNGERLGFAANFTQCFTLARGETVKFLNDDDRLRPGCVAALSMILRANPLIKIPPDLLFVGRVMGLLNGLSMTLRSKTNLLVAMARLLDEGAVTGKRQAPAGETRRLLEA